jgi:hypothetical protein
MIACWSSKWSFTATFVRIHVSLGYVTSGKFENLPLYTLSFVIGTVFFALF